MLDESVLGRLEVGLEQLLARRNASVRGKQCLDAGTRGEIGGALSSEQPRQEVGAIRGDLDKGLVQQMLDHVLPANVDDERELGTERNDVGKVLFRPDTDVHSPRWQQCRQLRNHGLERAFVRQEVVRPEVATGFRELVDQLPESLVAQSRRQSLRRHLSVRGEGAHPQTHDKREDRDDSPTAVHHGSLLTPDPSSPQGCGKIGVRSRRIVDERPDRTEGRQRASHVPRSGTARPQVSDHRRYFRADWTAPLGTIIRPARHMRTANRRACLTIVVAVALWPLARHGKAQPAAQTSQSFSARVDQLSEAGGDFDTDNLISNERSYLDVVPTLRKSGVAGGAYIGVGPDQNFSYIAQIRPSIAFIVDIRRDNLLLHLLFKALFGAARNRLEYLSLLTGRPAPAQLEAWRDASLERIVAYIDGTKPDGPSVDRLDRRLHDAITRFGVPLTAADFSTIERFHRAFVKAGLSLKFESRGRPARAAYPTYRDLLMATDRGGQSWNFLASESDYQFVRSLQLQDLIVPVVGDLGGTHAIAAIADLTTQRGERLSAFYISNVETYLYGDKYGQFVANVRRLPRDARSVIIRSTFRASISASEIQPANELVSSFRSGRLLDPGFQEARPALDQVATGH